MLHRSEAATASRLVLGAGPQSVIAVHCSLARASAFGGLAAALAGRAQVVAHDLPGHGQAADFAGGDYLAAALAPMLAEIDHAPQPPVLLGHSFGGVVALAAALARPGMLKALVLIEPVLFAALRDGPFWAPHLAQAAGFRAALAEGRVEDAAREFLGIWGSGLSWEATPARQRAYFVQRMPLMAAIEGVNDSDPGRVLARLPELCLPVLLLRGATSPASIGAVSAEIARRIPQAQEVIIDGAGHMLPLTHPGAVAGAMGRFFSS